MPAPQHITTSVFYRNHCIPFSFRASFEINISIFQNHTLYYLPMTIGFPNEFCTCRTDSSISSQSTSGQRNQCSSGSPISSHCSFKLIPRIYLLGKITICRTCTTQIFCSRKIYNNPCICCRNIIQSNVIRIIAIPLDIEITCIIFSKIHCPLCSNSAYCAVNFYICSMCRRICSRFILLGRNRFGSSTVFKHIEYCTGSGCTTWTYTATVQPSGICRICCTGYIVGAFRKIINFQISNVNPTIFFHVNL
ncbi:unknown [Bacteroides cellulosilyticus CAG:158]|nr:unknown [Bacteroides cellulosilyticus CAG:158]